MDQERIALDVLTAALNDHFVQVDAACKKIIDLINSQPPPADPDVDNSAEIAALAGQIQAATDAEPQQVMLANIVGFLVFAVVLGILANISEVYNTGGLAPGLFFFNLNP